MTAFYNPAQDMRSDDELLSSQPRVAAPQSRSFSVKLAAVGIFAPGACLAGVQIAGVVMMTGTQKESGMTVRQLYESPELAQVLTDQVMQIHRQEGRHLGFQDSKKVKKEMVESLSRRGAQMGKLSDQMTVTQEEKDGVLHMVNHLSDRRLQAIGKLVGRTLRDSKHLDKSSRRQMIVEALRGHSDEIRQLRAELFQGMPKNVRGGQASWDKLLGADVPHGVRRLVVTPAAIAVAPPTPLAATVATPEAQLALPFGQAPSTAATVGVGGVVQGVAPPIAAPTVSPDGIEEAAEITQEVDTVAKSVDPLLQNIANNNNATGMGDAVAAVGPALDIAHCLEEVAEKETATTAAPIPVGTVVTPGAAATPYQDAAAPTAVGVPPPGGVPGMEGMPDPMAVLPEVMACVAKESTAGMHAIDAVGCDLGMDDDQADCIAAHAMALTTPAPR